MPERCNLVTPQNNDCLLVRTQNNNEAIFPKCAICQFYMHIQKPNYFLYVVYCLFVRAENGDEAIFHKFGIGQVNMHIFVGIFWIVKILVYSHVVEWKDSKNTYLNVLDNYVI